MSTDARVTKDLMETLEDGREGFNKAAEEMANNGRSDYAAEFRRIADERAKFYTELEQMAAAYGDDIDPDGTVAGTLHRVWMGVRDTLAFDDVEAVLKTAEQGEDHAVSEYEKALESDISAGLRTAVERQFGAVKAAHDKVRNLRDHHA